MRSFRQNGGLRRADYAVLGPRAVTMVRRAPLSSITALSRAPLLNARRSLHASSPTRAAVFYPAVPQLTNNTLRRTLKPSRYTPLVTVRHCSHRRNMCRHSGAEEHSSTDITQGRQVLPTNVKPVHYDLTLEPDFKTFTYEGTVVIEYVPAQSCGGLLADTPPAWTLPKTAPQYP